MSTAVSVEHVSMTFAAPPSQSTRRDIRPAAVFSRALRPHNSSLEVLHDISFRVEHGRTLVILGPSGCGKSTLLRMIAGLEFPMEGRVSVADSGGELTEVNGPGPDRGMVFQSYTSFPWLSALRNVEFALRRVRHRGERRESARRYLRVVGLEGFENFLPRDLSGGMRQRVALARSLAAQPSVLLFDEPFGALDAQTRGQMQEEVPRLVMSEGTGTMVFVTHDVEEAVFLADQVVVLTSRPAQVRRLVQITGRSLAGYQGEEKLIPKPSDRSREFKSSWEFLLLRREIEALLDNNGGSNAA